MINQITLEARPWTSYEMCWKEYTTKYYECGATTGNVRVNMPEAAGIQTTSTTGAHTCDIFKTARAKYDEYKKIQRNTGQPSLDFRDWVKANEVPACENGGTTYWATWKTNRQCVSGGLNGVGRCQKRGKPHGYPNAPGAFTSWCAQFLNVFASRLHS